MSYRAAAYDKIDRYLRNNLDDSDYAEFSAALEMVWEVPTTATPAQVVPASGAKEPNEQNTAVSLLPQEGVKVDAGSVKVDAPTRKEVDDLLSLLGTLANGCSDPGLALKWATGAVEKLAAAAGVAPPEKGQSNG